MTSALPSDVEALRQIVATRDAEIAILRESLKEAERATAALKHQIDLLRRSVYGQKSERVVTEQGLLAFAGSPQTPPPAAPEPEAEEPPADEGKRRGGHGRQRLPAHLRREEIVHDVPPEERVCGDCDKEMAYIGDDECEQLEWIPGRVFVRKLKRRKYACRKCGTKVVTAPAHDQTIERGLPGPGLLSQIVTSKYADHLPLHRMEGILAREGVEISRSTMCDWISSVAALLEPVWRALKAELLASGYIRSDETPVRVLDIGKTRTGYVRVYACERPRRIRVYQYAPDRGGGHVLDFLRDWAGHFQADAFSGYDAIYTDGRVIEFGCNAHARRYFFDAKATDMSLAHAALARYRLLYAVESEADDADRKDGPEVPLEEKLRRRHELRQARSKPVLAEFELWLRATQPTVLPKSPIGEAVAYALNHWTALSRFADNPRIAIDNNLAERELRAVAVGRKNWEFLGTDEGGGRAAILYSITATCKANRVDPWAYINDVLQRISTLPENRVRELLPDEWLKARQAQTPAK